MKKYWILLWILFPLSTIASTDTGDQKKLHLHPSSQAATIRIRGENKILSIDSKKIPEQILKYCFEFEICMPKVWRLEAPTVSFPIADLLWHLDITPWDHNGQAFAIGPQDVMDNPEAYPAHFKRIQNADLSYPIDLSYNNGKWVIIDGLHRLCAYLLKSQGEGVINARIHSREAIISCIDTELNSPEILKRYGFAPIPLIQHQEKKSIPFLNTH